MLYLALLTACLWGPASDHDADDDGVSDELDCDEDDAGYGEGQPWWFDQDGDGYGSPNTQVIACVAPAGYVLNAQDCDDADADISPDAAERCNGLDDNCDGDTPADEADADADGVLLCENDCDDEDPERFPSATERCDGLDNDCDGDIAAEELDEDGDGLSACEGDCDDSTPDASPDNLEEICRDGLDNNCNRVADECEVPPVLAPGDPRTVIVGDTSATLAATSSLVALGDIDGDGYDDVGMGAPLDDSAGAEAGALYVFTAPPMGPANLLDAAALRLTGASAGDHLGRGARLGDIDGDTLGDIAVAAPGADLGRGRVFVAYGDELVAPITSAGALATSWTTAVDNSQLGSSLTAWRDRVVLGAPGIGTVYAAPTPTPGQNVQVETVADAWVGPVGQEAGFSVARLGDFNGDGLDDLAIGGPATQDATLGGRVWVVLGAPDGSESLTEAVLTLRGVPGDLAGYAVASAGDVTGDGYDDLLIGAPGANNQAGAVYLVHGRAMSAPLSDTLSHAALASWTGTNPGDRLGASVTGIGDFDDDGSIDLAMGAPGDDQGGTDAGAVWLHSSPFLGPARVDAVPETRLLGAQANSQLGSSVLPTGDFDRDGYGDLMVSLTGNSLAGSAWFVWGTGL